MNNFGKRNSPSGDIEGRTSGTCFVGCIVTCKGLCNCTGKKAVYTADVKDYGGYHGTTVWGKNYVNSD